MSLQSNIQETKFDSFTSNNVVTATESTLKILRCYVKVFSRFVFSVLSFYYVFLVD
jgi:hypothetical protein